jgi:hypothetical protein
MADKNLTCCICGCEYNGNGNSPLPIDKDPHHRCCDICNEKVVMPARYIELWETLSHTHCTASDSRSEILKRSW